MRLNLILIFLVIFLLFNKTKESFVLKKDCLRLKGKLRDSPNSKQCGNYKIAAKKHYKCGECIRNIFIENGDVCTTNPKYLDTVLQNLNVGEGMHKDGKYLSKVNTECLMAGHCDGVNTNKQVMEEVVKKCCGTYELNSSGRWVKRKDENTTPDTYEYGAICNLTNREINEKAKLLKVL